MNFRLFLLLTMTLCALSAKAQERFLETFSSSYGQSFEISKSLYREKSDFSDLAIFENPLFGRVLAIDGAIRMTEKDEHIYSEMITHIPLLAHGAPREVLILGGGDGTILREVLKHTTVEKVVLVEKDTKLIELAKRYFGAILDGAFEDPRLRVVITDAKSYCDATKESFDVVICDIPGMDYKKQLNPGGIFVSCTRVCLFERDPLAKIHRTLKGQFNHTLFYIISVPSHPWGTEVITWSSDVKQRLSIATLEKRMENVRGKMHYYNPLIHKASFRLPQYFFK